jgi:hypothetical protein
LKQANSFPDSTLLLLENLFNETIDTIYTILGEDAFLLPNITDREQKSPRVSIYDGIMQSFAQNILHKSRLLENKERIKSELYQNKELLLRDKDKNPYLFDGRYNNRKDVLERIDYYNNFLQGFVNPK